MTKTKQKNLKPIDIDLHLKYKCPESTCRQNHWLSLRETKTKNFKIVCDCGLVFSPKRISKINIKYHKRADNKEKTVDQIPSLSTDLQQKCVKLLTRYGFTDEESVVLIDKAWTITKNSSPTSLVKFVLQNLGELSQ